MILPIHAPEKVFSVACPFLPSREDYAPNQIIPETIIFLDWPRSDEEERRLSGRHV